MLCSILNTTHCARRMGARLHRPSCHQVIIDSHMRYVLAHAEPRAGYDVHPGALVAGGDVRSRALTHAQLGQVR